MSVQFNHNFPKDAHLDPPKKNQLSQPTLARCLLATGCQFNTLILRCAIRESLFGEQTAMSPLRLPAIMCIKCHLLWAPAPRAVRPKLRALGNEHCAGRSSGHPEKSGLG